jgi:TonB family protein
MRLVILLAMLLVTDYVAASGRRLDPEQAATRVDTTAVRSRMADIEMHLGCGATATETIYVYQPNLTAQESLSLAPSILVSGRGVELLATPRHSRAGSVDSVGVLSSSGTATIALKAGTGAEDFVTDSSFRSVMLKPPPNEQVRARLYRHSTSAEFSISSRERRAWREVASYLANFHLRSGKLPHVHERLNYLPFMAPHTRPRAIEIPEAYYPDQVRRAGIDGRVVAHAHVDTAGVVRTALVLMTSGHELLDLAGVRAALDATFIPGRVNKVGGLPTPVWAAIPYAFRLD